mmetsp:Transcript_59267/g.105317  ORF Transcript_59267/g.105317 Transcript_59267/m.105317 type:complete len:584 (+) Transcript_59267:46-1797(+)
MGVVAPLNHLNLLVVLGAQLQKPSGEVNEKLPGSCEHEAPMSPRRQTTGGLRRRRATALPAADMMASICVLTHGMCAPLGNAAAEGDVLANHSDQMDCGPYDCLDSPRDDVQDATLPVPPFPPTRSSSSTKPPRPHSKKVDPDLERMCQNAFPDMVMIPRSVVDLDAAYQEKLQRTRETVSKIILVLSNDNIAALVVIATLNIFGAIYLWKICTRRSCSCKICRNQYRTLSLLGSGGYGSVYLVERLPGMEKFVSKKILISDITECEEYSREAKELITLRHRHIVSYEDDFVHVEYGGLEPKTYFMIIMEYCPEGDLKEKIELDFLSFTEGWIRSVFFQLLQAVQYLHSKNVIHRDLKSQNVFLAHNGRVRLGDFGLCRHAPGAALGSATLTHAGTDCYMAPEMLSSSRYGKPADMWSLGCVLYELCTGQFMWELEGILGALVMKDSNALQKYVQTEICPAVGTELRALMKRLLNPNPASRPTATQCMRKKLFRRGFPVNRQTFGESLGEPVETPPCDDVVAEFPEDELDKDEEVEEQDEEQEASEQEEEEEELSPGKTRCAPVELPHKRQQKRRKTKKGWRI